MALAAVFDATGEHLPNDGHHKAVKWLDSAHLLAAKDLEPID
jgi:hypothetical protein